jgi:hypothetical protein
VENRIISAVFAEKPIAIGFFVGGYFWRALGATPPGSGAAKNFRRLAGYYRNPAADYPIKSG